MEQVLKRFSESFAQQTKIRIQVAASGLKLENGYVSAEFFKDGRSIGLADDLRPGDQIYDMDFDRVELVATPGKAWAGDVVFYLSTGRIMTDRILEDVTVTRGWVQIMERRGGRVTLTCANPSPVTARAGFMLKSPETTGNYPNIVSNYNVIWSMWLSKQCRMYVVPLKSDLSGLDVKAPGLDTLVGLPGSVGYVPLPGINPNPMGMNVSCWMRRGEWVPALPDGAVILPAGQVDFDPPLLLMPGYAIEVQAEASGTLEAVINLQTERKV